MAANTAPIYPLTPNNGFGTIITGNTALDGTGTAVLVYTAGANGSRVDQISAWHLGTNIATVMRFFINNGATQGTGSNNTLVLEATMAANTVSQVAESVPVLFKPTSDPSVAHGLPIDSLILPATYRIYATVGTTVASGIRITVLGGDY